MNPILRFLTYWLRRLFILPIRFYQIFLSPLYAPRCRYQPTCSQYTIEAIEEWGVLRGIWLGMKRIGRCHPWSNHAHLDPVPKKEQKL
jgi:uncharacterized protein